MVAVFIILIWAASGPIFRFSDTWQLVINTSTTIITFLMVFLIQNTQNRDSEATQLKLDELIRAIGGAENTLIDLEEREEGDLDQVRETYQQLANSSPCRKPAEETQGCRGGPRRKRIRFQQKVRVGIRFGGLLNSGSALSTRQSTPIA